MNESPTFVVQVDTSLSPKLVADLTQQGFEISIPPHTRFSAKKPGLICTLYESGKLVVQGKEKGPFIEFYLEPEILGSFSFTHPTAEIDLTSRIGIDESGKGDFFGPLCIAGVFAKEEDIKWLLAAGVKDSKSISDQNIYKIAGQIKQRCLYHIVRINPFKYNEIYADFKNLNRLLAWGHATTIEQLVQKTNCSRVLIDQFADESVVETALRRKKLKVNLSQRHRAESDPVVAAASILARHAFLEGLEQLGQDIGILLPKGASKQTIAAGKKIFAQFGREGLAKVGKLHFKTLDAILGKASD